MIIPIPGVPNDYIGNGQTMSAYQINQANREQNQFNAQEAATQRKWSADQAALTRSFNAQEASKQRSWEAQMSNTAHTREVADLRAAGLNPVLSANSGASTPSAAAASASSPSGSSASGSSASGALASYLSSIISAQASIENTRVNAEASRYASELMAQVNRYAAQMSFAGTKYSSDTNYRNAELQREFSKDYPSNMWQFISSMAGNLSGSANGISAFAGKTLPDMWSWLKSMSGVSSDGSVHASNPSQSGSSYYSNGKISKWLRKVFNLS